MSIEENKERKYFASYLKLEEDRHRLSLQEQTWDPFTIRHLETIGVSPGWACLNVGAGHGSITCWLAEKVGLTGKVVATDIRPELHRDVDGPVEVRKHDILKDELEQERYDLVLSRMLLQHLAEPEAALSRMGAAVKPGGWLLIQELDNSTFPQSDSRSPDADLVYKLFQKVIQNTNRAFVEFGRTVPLLLQNLGFIEIQNEANTRLFRGGEPWPRALIIQQQMSVSRYPDSPLVEEAERVIKLLEDPDCYFVSAPLFSAWGRKPE